MFILSEKKYQRHVNEWKYQEKCFCLTQQIGL